MNIKKCTKCGEVKTLDEFPKDKRNKTDGHKARCKKCTSEYRKQHHLKNKEKDNAKNREWYLKNKEHKNEQNKKWNKENRERIKEYTKKCYEENKRYYNTKSQKWYHENKEYANKLTREWYSNNKDRQRELSKKWRKENKEKARAIRHNRNSKLKMLPHDLTSEEWEGILSDFNGGCALTGSDEITLEHFIPVNSGHGGTVKGNVYPMQSNLNFSKKDKNPFEWFEKNKEHYKLSEKKWNHLIEYLANQNNMSVTEFKEYVNYCMENPKNVEVCI